VEILGDRILKTTKDIEDPKKTAKTTDTQDDFDGLAQRQWDIIEVLGSARACATAGIYKDIGCSGTVFKEQVEDLIENNFIGMKEGKVQRRKSHYYFLKPKGRRAFEQKYRSLKPVTETINIYPYMDFLKERGFTLTKKINDSVCLIEKDNSSVSLYFENTTDYDKIYENVSIAGSRCYVICSSERVKNAVTQAFARHAVETGSKNPNIVVFIITSEALDKRRNFSRIEFFHYEAPRDMTMELIKKEGVPKALLA